jgi:hypothetical protein
LSARACVWVWSPSFMSIQRIRLLLLLLRSYDEQHVFAMPVSEEIAPGYRSIVKKPMDFSTMQQKLQGGAYTSIQSYKARPAGRTQGKAAADHPLTSCTASPCNPSAEGLCAHVPQRPTVQRGWNRYRCLHQRTPGERPGRHQDGPRPAVCCRARASAAGQGSPQCIPAANRRGYRANSPRSATS